MSEQKAEEQEETIGKQKAAALEIVKQAGIDSAYVKAHLELFAACMAVTNGDAGNATLLYKEITVYPNWSSRKLSAG
jgi:hypothetical protein